MNEALQKFLEHAAYNMRISSLKMTTNAGSGHPTSALSAADIVAALFLYAMHFDPKNSNNPDNDRFILSKGHASPILYAVWKELGLLSEQDLLTYRSIDSVLEGHPTRRFSRTEAATGSLGQGLSVAVGIAMAAKMDKRVFRTYALLGDAEAIEGSVWEAVEVAAFYKLDNVVAIIDVNRLGQTAPALHDHDINAYARKFAAFGWEPCIVDGHSMTELIDAFEYVAQVEGKPSVIVAKTIKGFGVKEAEDRLGFHGKAFKPEELPEILAAMEKKFKQAATYQADFVWKPKLPEVLSPPNTTSLTKKITISMPSYALDQQEATRKAYGHAIAAAGNVDDRVVALDGEVKNSTFAEIFEKAHPDRFVQCFVAEQNMVGMAVGMANRGKVPFVSTFGAFFTRAFDQIRMAAIGQASLRLTGSHAGVSIGQDGPSQMGLEDIAMMRSVPGSIVLYPSDAVSAYKIIELMANYDDGISYMRTTRMATPVLYPNDETFAIGGCKVLRQSDHDVACVVGAGITLHNALQAYEQLQQKGIDIAVIDLYSIKPLDQQTVLSVAQKSNGKIITAEDHYLEGGLGQAVVYSLRNEDIHVTCLAVKKLPRSGTPEALMELEEIDADSIVNVVEKLG